MKKIILGSFFGKNIYLEISEAEIEEAKVFDYPKRFEDYIESIKKQAVRESKDALFFEDFEKKYPKHPTFFTGIKEFIGL